MLIFTLTIFLGAVLLFQVELIIGKTILPWFGGTSAVWITCMLFFQVLLLAGYAYGHALDRARVRAQSRLHQLLLALTVAVLAVQLFLWHSPLILDASWKPRAGGNPLLQILTLLTVSVGLPYLVLASTAPLLQSWWRRLYPQRSPYPLYAVSNFGSFLGLVSYPFLVEPFLTLKTQALAWSVGYAAFVTGCAYCATQASRAQRSNLGPGFSPASATDAPAATAGLGAAPFAVKGAGLGLNEGVAEECRAEARRYTTPAGMPQAPTSRLIVLWLSLAACASALLLATTNQLCKNVAAVPLLWVLPLAIYLLTFTLCFESDRRYSRKWFHPAFALGTFLICFVLATGAGKNLPAQIAIYSFGLFAACMVCHGELARLKPDPRHLTLFYLVIAAGGVLGGLFVALAAPYLFVGYWEYEVSLWLAALLFLVVLYRDRSSWLYSARVPAPLVLIGAAALLPESMALAVGSTQLAGSIPSVVVIVGALYLLQGQARRRKAAPGRTAASGSSRTHAADSVVLRLSDDSAAPMTAAAHEAHAAETHVAPGFSPALFADSLDEPATRTLAARSEIAGIKPGPTSPAPSRESHALSPAKTRTLNTEGCGTQSDRDFGRFGGEGRAHTSAGEPAGVPTREAAAATARRGKFSLLASCAIVLLVLGATLTTVAKATLGQIASVRNFYGALTIDHQFPTERDREAYALKHGEIFHGFEFRIPQRHLVPTSYFSEDSGLGLVLAPHLHASDPPDASSAPSARDASTKAASAASLRIGDVGLGIGTVAAYARPGDSVRFYEINPQVVMLASDPRYFQFLHESAAPVDVALGDGRLTLERELAQGARNDYDVLIVDAFNGDAVPVHLLTIEAFQLYLQRLKSPSGVLAMNVTNTFLDLRPVVVAAAERLGLASLWVHCDGDGLVSYTNDWMLLSRDPAKLDAIAAAANDSASHPNTHAATLAVPQSRLWTDNYSNLFRALR